MQLGSSYVGTAQTLNELTGIPISVHPPVTRKEGKGEQKQVAWNQTAGQ